LRAHLAVLCRAVHGAGLCRQPDCLDRFSIFPTDTPERDQLLSNAKLAMHRGKSTQGGSICATAAKMDDSARKRRELARILNMRLNVGTVF